MGGGPHWTLDEIARLRSNYETAPRAELLKMFPGRSAEALKQRAGKLGLQRLGGVSFVRRSPLRRELSKAELAYIAGIIDGEGHITIIRAQRAKARFPLYTPVVGVTNQSKVLIEWLAERVVWTMRGIPVETSGWGWSYRPAIAGHGVVELLRPLLPYLVIKRRQAELVLRFCEMRAAAPVKPLSSGEIAVAEQVRVLNRPKAQPTSPLSVSSPSSSKLSTT